MSRDLCRHPKGLTSTTNGGGSSRQLAECGIGALPGERRHWASKFELLERRYSHTVPVGMLYFCHGVLQNFWFVFPRSSCGKLVIVMFLDKSAAIPTPWPTNVVRRNLDRLEQEARLVKQPLPVPDVDPTSQEHCSSCLNALHAADMLGKLAEVAVPLHCCFASRFQSHDPLTSRGTGCFKVDRWFRNLRGASGHIEHLLVSRLCVALGGADIAELHDEAGVFGGWRRAGLGAALECSLPGLRQPAAAAHGGRVSASQKPRVNAGISGAQAA